MTEYTPSVGRIVRYHRFDEGRPHAAIITDVMEGIDGATLVDLDIFWGHRTEDVYPPHFSGWFHYSPDGLPGTWSWPDIPAPNSVIEIDMNHGHGHHRLGFITAPGPLA